MNRNTIDLLANLAAEFTPGRSYTIDFDWDGLHHAYRGARPYYRRRLKSGRVRVYFRFDVDGTGTFTMLKRKAA